MVYMYITTCTECYIPLRTLILLQLQDMQSKNHCHEDFRVLS
jgi:hypothetical protein